MHQRSIDNRKAAKKVTRWPANLILGFWINGWMYDEKIRLGNGGELIIVGIPENKPQQTMKWYTSNKRCFLGTNIRRETTANKGFRGVGKGISVYNVMCLTKFPNRTLKPKQAIGQHMMFAMMRMQKLELEKEINKNKISRSEPAINSMLVFPLVFVLEVN